MNIVSNKTEVAPIKIEKVEYVQEKLLFGLLTHYSVVRRDKIGEMLLIRADREPEQVFINDTEYKKVTELNKEKNA